MPPKAARPRERKELIGDVQDVQLHRLDRLIAARALVRNFPAVVRSLDDLVDMVAPTRVVSPELFDVIVDAYRDVHPKEE